MNKRKVLSIIRRIRRIDILDGKKRHERVLRRLLILLMGISILVLALFVIHKEKEMIYQNVVKEEVNEVVISPSEEISEVVVEEVKQDRIKEYIYNYGGRINDEYLVSLRNYCDEDTLRLVVAISVAETNMGKATNNKSNFYGYFYGGDRRYDPSYDEMSMVICRGISKYYSDVATNRSKAVKYTGNDHVDMWMKNVGNVLSKMQ